MLSLLFGFSQIHARDIPDGVMPKRQVVGTGVTTSTSATLTSTSVADPTSSSVDTSSSADLTTPTSESTTPAPTTDPTTSDSPTPTSEAPASSSAVASTDSSSAAESSAAESSAANSSTADSAVTDSSSPSAALSSSNIPTTIAVTTTDASGSTIVSHIRTSTIAAVTPSQTRSPVIRTETGSKSNLVVFGSSTINRSTLTGATTITSALVAEETQPYTTTSYWTSDGSVYSRVITTNRVFASTTGYATATIAPSLANGGAGGSTLSPKTKSVVGGVVGGIGGAILLGGLAIVVWRLWGKKRRQRAEQDDYLDSRDDSIRREKRVSVAQPLNQYQNPGGNVNTASNF